ncbi:hypothetical protein JCM21900_001817, partial [Sporobolomyces salmonicolor]
DSLHHPRWTIHRPRRPITAISSSSAPWPAYLVLRSPVMRQGAFIPVIAPSATKTAKDESRETQERDKGLRFGLRTAVPRTERVEAGKKSSGGDALAGAAEGQDGPPATPTTPRARVRPLSTSVRVDMAPSLSASSTASGASAASSQPLHEPHLRMRPSASQDSTSPSPSFGQDWVQSTFRLQSTVPASFAASTRTGRTNGFGALVQRVRSWILDEPKNWSCVWEEEGREGAPADTAEAIRTRPGPREEVLMAFEEDSSGLMPSRTTGTLHLSPALVDASGMEPSFFVAVGLAWMEVAAERRAWEAGRAGD